MISIIICSRDKKALHKVLQSVAETIGVPYEIVAIDNSTKKYGICEAYNLGAAQAKYETLCFMHEDIRFHIDNWGSAVIEILRDATIGVLGVAGGTFQPKAPAGWGADSAASIYMNITHTVNGKAPKLDRVNSTDAVLVDVAAVDGVWLCVRKSVWQESPFDAVAFPGFHFYDIDFCTRIFLKYRICVTFNIMIEHFSKGSYDDKWYREALSFYKKRRQYLPFGVKELSDQEKERISLKELIYFTCGFIDRKISKADSVYLVHDCLARSSYKRESWWLIKKLLIGR